jgi:hypothetical protein
VSLKDILVVSEEAREEAEVGVALLEDQDRPILLDEGGPAVLLEGLRC